MKKIISIFAFFALFATISLPIFAEGESKSPAFSIRGAFHSENPYYFVYDVTPGSTIKDGVFIQNHDDERSIKLNLDFKPLILAGQEPAESDISEWIEFAETEIELGPKNNKTVEFAINIPEKTEIREFEGYFQTILTDYTADGEYKFKESGGGVGIALAVGSSSKLNVSEGDPLEIDRTKVEAGGPSVKKKEKEAGFGTKIFNFIQERMEIILIFVVILLLIKFTINNKCKTDKKDKK